MLSKKIHIENHVWEIQLSESRELEFYYLKEVEELNSSLWADWNSTDDESRYDVRVYDDNILPVGLSIFSVINKILLGSIALINQSGYDFFYFSASTERKGSFYESVIDKFINKIKGEWKYQVINSNWFYISKVND